MQLTRLMCPESKYSIKCPYSMTPKGITVHNTANDASAMSEISYMIGNNNYVSFHYAIDDYRVVQGIEENRNAFHASDGANGFGNRNTIAIEICYSKSGGDRFTKAEQLSAEFIASLLKKYNWGIDKVKRHYDYAPNKKYCPHRTMDLGWKRFLNMVKSYLGESTPQPTKSIDELAKEVIAGKWGNGVDRKKRLIDAGYDYAKVQARVNELLAPKVSYYPKFNSSSIVDGLKSIGVNSSFINRTKIANANGIRPYFGTASQNNRLCELARQGKLIRI